MSYSGRSACCLRWHRGPSELSEEEFTPNGMQKSAEGIVGDGNEPGPAGPGNARKPHPTEGPNGSLRGDYERGEVVCRGVEVMHPSGNMHCLYEVKL